jgi:beta-lactamase superfamily II metal-dependent hydrolase
MTNKTKKSLIAIIIVAIIALALVLVINRKSAGPSPSSKEPSSQDNITEPLSDPVSAEDSGKLIITNLNVGKADCAVIELDGIVGIIDSGTYESYGILSSFLQQRNVSKIDYLIITHYDQDHIGGSIRLLSDFQIENIYLPDYVSEKKYYDDLMAAIKGHKNINYVTEPCKFSCNELSIEIFPADEPASLLESENNRDNNMSLVTMAAFGSKRFLFTGDIEKDRIAQMLSFDQDWSADWIKMPHHGEYQKKIALLLEAVLPRYAVISTSKERPPEEKLLELLKTDNIETYDTLNSNVTTICDGENITVSSN